ncbi:MAG: hypothetical protein C0511_18160 [Hyphomicrobium sp.]|nr:hypothetical protein [Hyphomicrobium sp.]
MLVRSQSDDQRALFRVTQHGGGIPALPIRTYPAFDFGAIASEIGLAAGRGADVASLAWPDAERLKSKVLRVISRYNRRLDAHGAAAAAEPTPISTYDPRYSLPDNSGAAFAEPEPD